MHHILTESSVDMQNSPIYLLRTVLYIPYRMWNRLERKSVALRIVSTVIWHFCFALADSLVS